MPKLIVFGTYHDVQGLKNFEKNVTDPDYKAILGVMIQEHSVDFIFEEASRTGPSVASEMAAGRYLDIDSDTTYQFLSQFSEASERLYLPEILVKSRVQDTARTLALTVEDRRERSWVEKIKTQKFNTGLVICGVVHSLSIAFRLQGAGFDVEAYHYEPIKRLCDAFYPRCGSRGEPQN